MKIEELVSGANLEDYCTEFTVLIQEGMDKKGEHLEIGWLKDIAAFANTQGGTLYVGVEDKSHEIVALSFQEADKVALMIQRLVKAHIEPPLKYLIRKISVPNTEPTRFVLAIDVEKSKMPPLSLHFGGSGTIYVRHFGRTSVATGEEIRSLVLSSDEVAFDVLDTNQYFKKEDFKVLFDFYAKQNHGEELKEKQLISAGFMLPDGRLKQGSLLFRDDCQDSRTLIECSQFDGYSKGDNRFLSTKTIKGNLIQEYLDIRQYVLDHSANGFEKTTEGRKTLISYPLRSLSEGIANALGHRNYFIQGGQTEINLYKDRLEIISPGSLIGSKWLKKEKDLSQIPPLRRNSLICDVMTMCRIMDHKGSGFDKIEEEYKPYGDEFAPFADSDASFFALTLPDLTHASGLVSLQETPAVSVIEPLTEKHALEILSFCYSKGRTVKEIADYLSINPSSYFRTSILNPLTEKGYLILQDTAYPARYLSNREKVNLK